MFTICRNFNSRAQYGSQLMNSIVICAIKMLLENDLLYSNRVNLMVILIKIQVYVTHYVTQVSPPSSVLL